MRTRTDREDGTRRIIALERIYGSVDAGIAAWWRHWEAMGWRDAFSGQWAEGPPPGPAEKPRSAVTGKYLRERPQGGATGPGNDN